MLCAFPRPQKNSFSKLIAPERNYSQIHIFKLNVWIFDAKHTHTLQSPHFPILTKYDSRETLPSFLSWMKNTKTYIFLGESHQIAYHFMGNSMYLRMYCVLNKFSSIFGLRFSFPSFQNDKFKSTRAHLILYRAECVQRSVRKHHRNEKMSSLQSEPFPRSRPERTRSSLVWWNGFCDIMSYSRSANETKPRSW